jgi:ABC-2 type transport system ATP-binding protein
VIELVNVTKTFGTTRALDALNLRIDRGDVFGFIGPNGAGKSTTMKILACLLAPDEGSARVAGLPCATHGPAIRRTLGYMPDFLGVYPDLRVHEYLAFFAAAFSLPRRDRKKTVDDVLDLTDLTTKREAMVESLSRGMQQRLGIARVLIHDPAVLLLDEPASGLDPRARIEIRSLLLELQRMGKTIMVSSHILSELHEMCNCIGIIEKGRLLYSGSVEHAIATSGLHQGLEVTVDQPEKAAAHLRQTSLCSDVVVEGQRLLIELSSEDIEPLAITKTLVEAGIGINALHRRNVKLEDVFLAITKGEVS